MVYKYSPGYPMYITDTKYYILNIAPAPTVDERRDTRLRYCIGNSGH